MWLIVLVIIVLYLILAIIVLYDSRVRRFNEKKRLKQLKKRYGLYYPYKIIRQRLEEEYPTP